MNVNKPRFTVLCLSVLMLAMTCGLSRAQAPNAAPNTANPQAPAGTNLFKFDSALDAILASDTKLEILKADANGKRLSGSNGLTLDRQHRVLIDATGDRAVERLEKDGSRTILADHYEGKHLGCVNDIVAKSDGAVYFTDGPAGCLEGGEN